jgi:hypothetical protein
MVPWNGADQRSLPTKSLVIADGVYQQNTTLSE